MPDNPLDKDEVLFVHSACCGGHWELYFDKTKREWGLCCPECGKSPGDNIKVTGPNMSSNECECGECKKEKKEALH